MRAHKRIPRFCMSVLALFLLGVFICGCQSQSVSTVPSVAQGPHVPMGKGEAWSWTRVDADGKVAAVGVSFTESALEGLPTEAPAVCCGGPEFILPMPSHINAGYTQTVINWNPRGHPPAGIYDKPHFDFHFYTVTEATRLAISGQGPDHDICLKPVPEGSVPTGFIQFPGIVPRMGVHWGNPAGEEFHGVPFTKTMIFGSYGGKIAFVEPMITMAYLQTHPDITVPVPPAPHPTPGLFFPATYSVSFDIGEKVYSVALNEAGK